MGEHYPGAVVAPRTRLVSIYDYPHLTLQVGREKVVAMWKQNHRGKHKETWVVEYDEPASLKAWIAARVEEIRATCDAALFDFVERTGLAARGAVPVWTRFEDYCKEPGLEKIPRDLVVYDSFFKKVYEEGVEFTPSRPGESPGERLSCYLTNRAFEEQEPRVLAFLERMRLEQKQEIEALRKEIVKVGLPVLRKRDESQKKLSRWS